MSILRTSYTVQTVLYKIDADGNIAEVTVEMTLNTDPTTTSATMTILKTSNPALFGQFQPEQVYDAVLALRGSGGITPPQPPAGKRLFHLNSVWNKPLTGLERLHPNSAGMIAHLVSNGGEGSLGTTISGITERWSAPVYTAPFGTELQKVICDGKSYYAMIPFPEGFYPSPDDDAKFVIYDDATGDVWSGSGMYYLDGEWHSKWSAVGSFDYGPNGDGLTARGRTDGKGNGGRAVYWGYMAGFITPEEMEAGVIEHALAITFPGQVIHPETFWWPAFNTDGHSSDLANSIPEGAHLRLDPDVDVEGLALTDAGKVIAHCLQTYGCWLGDRGDNMALNAEEFLTPDGQNIDPTPWDGLLAGDDFPAFMAEHLQVLEPADDADYYVEPVSRAAQRKPH